MFYIYQHFQDSEKIHQIDADSDVLTIQEDSLYPYMNNDIEYGLFEDLVESYHLDSQIKDDFQCDPDCYMSCHQDGGRSQGDTRHSMPLTGRQGGFNFDE